MRRTALDIKQAVWELDISDEQWTTYECVLDKARRSGPSFALGGAFALATATGRLRNTKDLDIYVLPADRQRMIDVLNLCGMRDYYGQLPYDRSWIYRGTKGDTIVDVIWAMANRRSVVDEMWLTRGPTLQVRNHVLPIIPVEELIWSKLYVMQRQRCDWPDVLNVIYHAGESIDWIHLFKRIEDDVPLLAGTLALFSWLCPDRAARIPSWVYDRAGIQPAGGPECGIRSHLLDMRPWFGPDFARSDND